MLLGLLGTAALVTVITVPAVLLSKRSKFEIFFKRNTTVEDQDLVLFYHMEENEGLCWGLEPARQVVAEVSQALPLPLLGQPPDSLTWQGLQRGGCESLAAAAFYV